MGDHEYGPHSDGEVSMEPKTTIELPFSPEEVREGRVRTAIQLRLPVGTGYEVHEFEYGKSYLVTLDPCFVNADDLDAIQNAKGLDITFIPAISTPRVATERAVARRCEYLARCRGDLVTAADIRREFGLEER